MKYDFSNLDKFLLQIPEEPDCVEVCLINENFSQVLVAYNTQLKEISDCYFYISFDCKEELKNYMEYRVKLHNQSIIDSF